MTLLRTERLSRSFGGLSAVSDVGISVLAGEIRALIGPNGAGKTTLLNLLAGTLKPDAGTIAFAGRDITSSTVHERARLGISRSFQVVNLFAGLTCRQVMQLALQRDSGMRAWLSSARRREVARRADKALLDAGLEKVADEESVRISHGLQKRLEIALALSGDARLLLLDEPMAGMTNGERAELRSHLRTLGPNRSVVFVEHDMAMVMSLADRVTVLHGGRVIAEGTPSEVRDNAAAQRAYLQVGVRC